MKLRNLQLAERDTPVNLRPAVLEFAARQLDQPLRDSSRSVLFMVFNWPEAFPYLDSMLRWHAAEDDDTSLQFIQGAILTTAGKRAASVVFEHFIQHTMKLDSRAVLFLLAVAKSKPALLQRVRVAFEQRRYDLEMLCNLTVEHPREYNILTSGSPFLTGRQCEKILQIQRPGVEVVFRRPEFVPYYARIEWSIASTEAELDQRIAAAGLPSLPQEQITRALCELAFGEAAPLAIHTLDSGEALALIALADATGDRVALVRAPPPDPSNLFPKRLLPPDHPLRYVKPEV
ncbi:MAG: hypothetical protein IT162_11560 [Bryobacterales bacterium]|nr:hypothetical protein [Bryobacterales bacterium]